jgi:hypothetical protein
MKTTYSCFEKGYGTHEKKKKKNKLFSRTKLKPMYQTKFFLVRPTNSVLQT